MKYKVGDRFIKVRYSKSEILSSPGVQIGYITKILKITNNSYLLLHPDDGKSNNSQFDYTWFSNDKILDECYVKLGSKNPNWNKILKESHRC